MDKDLVDKIRDALNEEWGYLRYYDDPAVETVLQKIIDILKEHKEV